MLKAFTSQGLSELTLLLKIQEYCYDNINFMKAFQKIVVLLYKGRFFTLCPYVSLFHPHILGTSHFIVGNYTFKAYTSEARWPEITD